MLWKGGGRVGEGKRAVPVVVACRLGAWPRPDGWLARQRTTVASRASCRVLAVLQGAFMHFQDLRREFSLGLRSLERQTDELPKDRGFPASPPILTVPRVLTSVVAFPTPVSQSVWPAMMKGKTGLWSGHYNGARATAPLSF